MKKNKNNILKILISIAFAIIIVNCHVVKADVTELQQDDKGRYCIRACLKNILNCLF